MMSQCIYYHCKIGTTLAEAEATIGAGEEEVVANSPSILTFDLAVCHED